MTPLARFLAEATPTRPPAIPAITPCTPEEQAQHRAELHAALANWTWTDETRISTQRRAHLRLINTETEAHAA